MRQIISNSFFIRVAGLGIGLGIGIAGMLFVGPGQTFATQNHYDKRLQSLQDSIALYHNTINDLFNARMKLLTSGKGDNTVYYKKDSTTDTDLPDETQCSDQNVSTFCVAEAAIIEFTTFETAMSLRAQRFWNEEDEDSTDTTTTATISTALLTQQLRAKAIKDEVALAEIALDRSLAAYNELHVSYPLHQQYEQIILDLTKYRDALAGVRDEVEIYPSKLLDASTPSCG